MILLLLVCSLVFWIMLCFVVLVFFWLMGLANDFVLRGYQVVRGRLMVMIVCCSPCEVVKKRAGWLLMGDVCSLLGPGL